MQVVIFDAGGASEVAAAVTARLAEKQATVRHFQLDTLVLAPCQGEFDCWVKTPGVCRTRDAARDLSQAMHDADLAVWVTPLTFGGFGSALKKALDRLICLIEPYFEVREGLTHHAPRYERYPALLCLGWSEATPPPESVRLLESLLHGVAVNLAAPWSQATALALRTPGWQTELDRALDAALERRASPHEESARPEEDLRLACAADAPTLPRRPARVTLLVGSAKPAGTSTSESLGMELIKGLREGGLTAEVVHAMAFVKPGRPQEKALAAILESDLLVVASPLYVDTLPGLVTRALELTAERLAGGGAAPGGLAGVFNCGFPEAEQNRHAIQVLRRFARETRLTWAGALAMGGGEAIHGAPLVERGGMVRHQLRGLALAAEHLAQGRTIPAEATTAFASPVLPRFLYRWMGTVGWMMQARRHGVPVGELHARPLEPAS